MKIVFKPGNDGDKAKPLDKYLPPKIESIMPPVEEPETVDAEYEQVMKADEQVPMEEGQTELQEYQYEQSVEEDDVTEYQENVEQFYSENEDEDEGEYEQPYYTEMQEQFEHPYHMETSEDYQQTYYVEPEKDYPDYSNEPQQDFDQHLYAKSEEEAYQPQEDYQEVANHYLQDDYSSQWQVEEEQLMAELQEVQAQAYNTCEHGYYSGCPTCHPGHPVYPGPEPICPGHRCEPYPFPGAYYPLQCLGYSYTPWQRYIKAYSPREALMRGTMFPELYSPYFPDRKPPIIPKPYMNLWQILLFGKKR